VHCKDRIAQRGNAPGAFELLCRALSAADAPADTLAGTAADTPADTPADTASDAAVDPDAGSTMS